MDRPRLSSALAFALCVALGLVEMALDPWALQGVHAVLAFSLSALAAVLLAVSLRSPRRTWLDPVPIYLFYGVLAVVFDATGGSTSQMVPLTGVGMLWVALFGTRRQVYVVAVLTALLFFAPIALVGAPAYPLAAVTRGLLWVAIAALVCPAVHEVVREWRLEHDRLTSMTREVEQIMQGSRLAAIIATDVSGTITSFGVGAERMLGYSADELVAHGTPALFHELGEVVEVAAELGVAPGFGVFTELGRLEAPSRVWTYVRKDGERLFVRLAVSEMHDADGEVVGYLGVAIDVSDAVRARRALALAEARWGLLMDNLPDTTVVTLDDTLTVGLVTGGGAMRVGLEGATGKHLSSVSKAENVAVIGGLVEDALRSGLAIGSFAATVNGHEHELLVTRLPTDDGPPQVLLMARDVSRERARERAVVQQKDKAERLFQHAPNGIVVLSRTGVVVEANPSLCRLLGRERAELVGTRLSTLSLRAGDTRVQDHLDEVMTSPGRRSESRWVARGADGVAVHVALTGTVLAGDDDEGTEDSVLVNVVDISERVRHEAQLAHVADHDPLTGLANRRKFDTALQAHVDHVQRYGPRGAVLMLDLDHFKDVNDTLGHGVGDQLIMSLADLLRRRMRTTDLVARLGGDEFAILLSDTDRVGAVEVAADVVRLVREHVASLDGVQRRVTVSVGGMLVDSVTLTPSDIMSMVDMMLYDAKDAGRNTYAMLDQQTHEVPRTGARMQWNDKIEAALERDDFELHLQPILDLASNRISGAEVLLRMRIGSELILPATFLYIAERSHLIVEIDRWVLRHSVPLLAELQRIDPAFRLEVNLSGKSVGDAAVEHELVAALDRHGVDPSGLVLEITETAAVASIEDARSFAERLSELGCRFALDDFGAGFGSFYYLKHLLFDFVKIDGEFIANCDTNPTDRTIVASIVQMAAGLGKETIAEFVSRESILEVVRAAGVDHAQGYFVGHPAPAAEVLAAMAEARTPRALGV